MYYRTIKAKLFKKFLFDVNTGVVYRLVNDGDACPFGYFLLKQDISGDWMVLKHVKLKFIHVRELSPTLPYFVRCSLLNFFSHLF